MLDILQHPPRKTAKNPGHEATVHTHLFAGQPLIRRGVFGEVQKSHSIPTIHFEFQQVMETVHRQQNREEILHRILPRRDHEPVQELSEQAEEKPSGG